MPPVDDTNAVDTVEASLGEPGSSATPVSYEDIQQQHTMASRAPPPAMNPWEAQALTVCSYPGHLFDYLDVLTLSTAAGP